MITAKNYATQVKKTLREYQDNFAKREMNTDALAAFLLGELINDAQHFAIQDKGLIFNDGLKCAIDLELRMPYPAVTIEYFMPTNEQSVSDQEIASNKRMILCIDSSHSAMSNISDGDHEGVFMFPFWDTSNGWGFPAYALWVPRKWNDINGSIKLPQYRNYEIPENEPAFSAKHIGIFQNTIELMRQQMGDEKFTALTERYIADMAHEARAVLEFFEALSCSNVTASPIEKVDAAKNARRIRDGKPPIYETKVLTVNCPAARYPRQSTDAASNRASPREHLRRGHIRRLTNGNRIWVNSAVIGSSGIGRIDKKYQIRSALPVTA